MGVASDLVLRLKESGIDATLWVEGESWIVYAPHFLAQSARDEALGDYTSETASSFAHFDEGLEWGQDVITIFGRTIPLPRLTAWYGDPGASYVYSGIRNEPKVWSPSLLHLRKCLEDTTGHRFNSVLANRYADGSQHQGYHADDERELGPSPVIASLSLGGTRRFLIKSKRDKSRETMAYDLSHGSLLIMGGKLQDDYVHAIGKTKKIVAPRINLTFRQVSPA